MKIQIKLDEIPDNMLLANMSLEDALVHDKLLYLQLGDKFRIDNLQLHAQSFDVNLGGKKEMTLEFNTI